MCHPVSVWDCVNDLVDSLGGLSVDEALNAAERHAQPPKDGEM